MQNVWEICFHTSKHKGLGIKVCWQIFFLCKALPYIFRKKLSKFLDIMYLCWFSSSAKHVALLLLMFSWKAFVLYYVRIGPKKVSNFCNADFAFWSPNTTNYSLWPWHTKGHERLAELLEKWPQKMKRRKVSFLSTTNVHLTWVINFLGLEFLCRKRRSKQGRI